MSVRTTTTTNTTTTTVTTITTIHSKECETCDQLKPLSAFHKRAKAADGHQRRCKQCIKEYYVANREHMIAVQQRYRAENPETVRDTQARSRQKARDNDTSCVYKISYPQTGQYYIGATSAFNARTYNNQKTLEAGVHSNPKLQALYTRLGQAQPFTYEILQECEISELKDIEGALLEAGSEDELCLNIQAKSNYNHRKA